MIVGARCAGAPLGALLAKSGVRVAIVEQATFPRNTLSSHVMQADALAFLNRLGVIPQVRATKALFMRRADLRVGDFRFVMDYPQRPGDVGGAAAIRRHILDSILANAAAQAGADLRMGTKVVGVLREAGRVVGVRATHAGSTYDLRAGLVVGADGTSSAVAKYCGARQYNRTESERWYYWTYFEGADLSPPATFVYHRWGDKMVFGGPSDSSLYLVGVSPEATERARFRADLGQSVLEHARSCEPIARVLERARRATKIFGIRRFTGYFREPAGPGWVLVGDAGHFKDPALGRGIGDAFLQVDALAPLILAGLDGSGDPLDRCLAAWGDWRDHKFAGHYWVACDIGRAGAMPALAAEVVRGLHRRGRADEFLDMLSHRARYYEVFTTRRVLTAAGQLVLTGCRPRRELLRDLAGAGVEDVRRRWLNRHPRLAPQAAPRADARAAGAGAPRPAGAQAPL